MWAKSEFYNFMYLIQYINIKLYDIANIIAHRNELNI